MTSSDRLEGIRFNRKFLVVKQACRKDTGVRQRITNTGGADLIFLAVCTPRFTLADYEDVESEGEQEQDHDLTR